MAYAATPHRIHTQMPSEKEIARIPLSKNEVFALSDRETRLMRSHLYKINHDGIRRYRTQRDYVDGQAVLLVWRIK